MKNSHTALSPLTNTFWYFSLTVYQDEHVKNLCLSLQTNYQANVNLLLLCCWLAYAVEEINSIELEHAFQKVADWQDHVTQPLRQTRQWLKANNKLPTTWINDFYKQLLQDELLSEFYQQQLLYTLFAAKQKNERQLNSDLARCYLHHLFQHMNKTMSTQLKQEIDNFIQQVLVTTHPC